MFWVLLIMPSSRMSKMPIDLVTKGFLQRVRQKATRVPSCALCCKCITEGSKKLNPAGRFVCCMHSFSTAWILTSSCSVYWKSDDWNKKYLELVSRSARYIPLFQQLTVLWFATQSERSKKAQSMFYTPQLAYKVFCTPLTSMCCLWVT